MMHAVWSDSQLCVRSINFSRETPSSRLIPKERLLNCYLYRNVRKHHGVPFLISGTYHRTHIHLTEVRNHSISGSIVTTLFLRSLCPDSDSRGLLSPIRDHTLQMFTVFFLASVPITALILFFSILAIIAVFDHTHCTLLSAAQSPFISDLTIGFCSTSGRRLS